MGCTQVRVIPDHSPNPNRSTRSRILENVSDELGQSTVSRTPNHPTPTTIFDRLSITPATWNTSEDLNQHSAQSNDYHDTKPNGMLNRYDTSTSRHSIFTSSSTVIERKDTPISRISIIKPFDLNSNVSDIPEVSSMSISSSEFNPRPSTYGLVITSSTDVNQKVFYQDAMKRFLSSRPKRPINHPTSRYRNTWSRPNKSHTDMINSMSNYSGESASDLAKDISTTSVRPIPYKTSVKDTRPKPDQSRFNRIPKKSSTSKEKKMTIYRSKKPRQTHV